MLVMTSDKPRFTFLKWNEHIVSIIVHKFGWDKKVTITLFLHGASPAACIYQIVKKHTDTIIPMGQKIY
jgi:hypothetical protein